MASNTRRQTESNTDNVLVVLDPEDPKASMRDVPPISPDATVHLLLAYPEKTVAIRKRAHQEIGIGGYEGISQLRNEASRDARRVGIEYLESDTEFSAIGAVGDRAEVVAETARRTECDAVYVAHGGTGLLERVWRYLKRPSRLEHLLPSSVDVFACGNPGQPDHSGPALKAARRPESN